MAAEKVAVLDQHVARAGIRVVHTSTVLNRHAVVAIRNVAVSDDHVGAVMDVHAVGVGRVGRGVDDHTVKQDAACACVVQEDCAWKD